MKKSWILVSNGSHAKLFTSQHNQLSFLKEFSHPLPHPVHEKPQHHNFYSTTDKQEVKLKEKSLFIEEIVTYLENSDHQHLFDALLIIAPAQTLGLLRTTLSSTLHKKITHEIPKDLIHMTPEQIREYLPPVL